MEVLESIKKLIETDDYRLTIHALERCTERDISPNEVREVLLSGEIIENYPKDKYGPSCLICGLTKADRILHVQCSIYPIYGLSQLTIRHSIRKDGIKVSKGEKHHEMCCLSE